MVSLLLREETAQAKIFASIYVWIGYFHEMNLGQLNDAQRGLMKQVYTSHPLISPPYKLWRSFLMGEYYKAILTNPFIRHYEILCRISSVRNRNIVVF